MSKPPRAFPRLPFPRRMPNRITYRGAGVDVDGADRWLASLRGLMRTASRREALPDRGQFAGLFDLGAWRGRQPVLVASTDGVGTKLEVARGPGDHEGIGLDVVAMNVNDVVTYGAEPLFFLDYLAIGKLQPVLMNALLRGVVRGCRQSGCALLGGETAEMPGAYGPGRYDIAGFCVGIVDRARLIDGSGVRAGDRIVGLASTGVHANGFSLVRRVFSRAQLSRLRSQLLQPTRIYVKPLLEALREIPIHAMAHITGGGIARRIPSLVSRSRGLRARLIPGSWPTPSIFHAIQRAGGLTMDEMASTFNMGVGMAVVCRADGTGRLARLLARRGIAAWVIGAIEREKHSQRRSAW